MVRYRLAGSTHSVVGFAQSSVAHDCRSSLDEFEFKVTGINVISQDISWLGGQTIRLFRRFERLIQIREDIIDVLDPDAQANHLGLNAGPALLFR